VLAFAFISEKRVHGAAVVSDFLMASDKPPSSSPQPATTLRCPYIDEALLDWRGGRPQLYLQTFSRALPRFAALGPAEFDGAVWPVFDDLADLVARGFAALERGEPAYERLRAIVRGPAPDVSGGVRHVASDRHAAYLHRESLSGLIRDLRRRLGWPDRLVASSAVQTLTA
jgi:hypothetical protein